MLLTPAAQKPEKRGAEVEESKRAERKEDVRWTGGVVAPPPMLRSPFAPDMFLDDRCLFLQIYNVGVKPTRSRKGDISIVIHFHLIIF